MILSVILYCVLLIVNTLPLSEGLFHELSVTSIAPPEKLRNESLFGYSISYQEKDQKLIVSAPKADNVGQVFECSLESNRCTRINITVNADRMSLHENKLMYNHDLLLGSTVVSGADFSVTCAPRSTKNYFYHKNQQYRLGTFGECYSLSGSKYVDDVTIMKSLPKKEAEMHADKFENLIDGYGWSAYVANKHVLIGSPVMASGRLLFYEDSNAIPKLIAPVTINQRVMFNLGYRVVAANFYSSDPSKISYATSTPYGEYGVGKVFVFDIISQKVIMKKVIVDEAVGALFGAALSSGDIDGDGLADLLVGSPTYVPEDLQEYDVGAVHVYLSSTKLLERKTIVGHTKGGYFGAAVISIGDMNNDGCDEICIGAPYEDDGRGAIYIYSGATLNTEVSFKWIQRIQAEIANGFGVSLSSLHDYDNNGCNELAVGAPDSNIVLLFRCIQTITLTLTPQFPNIQLLSTDLEKFNINSCFNITFPTKPKKINATIRIHVDLKHKNATIINPNNGTALQYEKLIFREQEIYCRTIEVSIPKDGDYSELLEYRITALLLDSPINDKNFDPSRVILNSRSTTSAQGFVSAARNCMDVTKCVPILTMNMYTTLKDDYVIGSTESENVTVLVRNDGDTAYAACVRVHVRGVRVLLAPATCTRHPLQPDLLTCAPPHPLSKNNQWKSSAIVLETKFLTSVDKTIMFVAKLHDYCKNEKVNETITKIINMTTDKTGLSIKSSSDQEELIKFRTFEINNNNEENNIKYLIHTYTIINTGPTTWTGLKIILQLEQQRYLTYSNVKINVEYCDVSSLSDLKVYNVSCDLPELGTNGKIDVHVHMEIQPRDLATLLNENNATVNTKLILNLDGVIKSESFSNILYLVPDAVVPLGIILAASVVGVLLLLLMGFALYEIGFFGRKNKAKLQRLKEDIKRQSMRQSMLVATRDLLKHPQSLCLPDNELTDALEEAENNHGSR